MSKYINASKDMRGTLMKYNYISKEMGDKIYFAKLSKKTGVLPSVLRKEPLDDLMLLELI